MEWFERWFGSDYQKLYSHRDDAEAKQQVDFFEKHLSPSTGANILDLCCGAGRHSDELSRRGYGVTGLDLSTDLLESAVERTNGMENCPEFVCGDMRELYFPEGFDAVVCFFTSFGYFEKEQDNIAVIESVNSVLSSGGGFLLDYFNPEQVRAGLVPEDEKTINGMSVKQERWIDEDRNRVEKKITISEGNSKKTYQESVRMYSHEEIESIFEHAGFRVSGTFGDFSGETFSPSAPRMIVTAEKI